MAFFKFRQRGQPQPPPEPKSAGRRRKEEPAATGPQETIDTLRRRARHRLLGAAVLVAVAVIGFPLLFDTQPRPVAVNAPITIPDKDHAEPLRVPAAPPAPLTADASLDEREEVVTAATSSPRDTAAQQAEAEAARAKQEEVTRAQREQEAKARADEQARARREADARARQETAAARAKQDDAAAARAKQEAAARAQREQEAKARADEQARAKREAEARAKREEAARARALLEGRGTAGATSAAAQAGAAQQGRFIVQVGAFADESAVRDARQRAERAGVKTYTQVVQTAAGPRTRVRVGPFGTRAEAEKAAAALKKAGLGGVILSL
ncbi:MAG: SPOR domain-containing protein [Pseudomonadota bacterium]|nr:SPOR domain-containing protein [Pseudomonadota bacterium]